YSAVVSSRAPPAVVSSGARSRETQWVLFLVARSLRQERVVRPRCSACAQRRVWPGGIASGSTLAYTSLAAVVISGSRRCHQSSASWSSHAVTNSTAEATAAVRPSLVTGEGSADCCCAVGSEVGEAGSVSIGSGDGGWLACASSGVFVISPPLLVKTQAPTARTATKTTSAIRRVLITYSELGCATSGRPDDRTRRGSCRSSRLSCGQ